MIKHFISTLFIFAVVPNLYAESVYLCQGVYTNKSCEGQNTSKPVEFRKNYSKTTFVDTTPDPDSVRGRYDFRKEMLLNELTNDASIPARPSDSAELDMLSSDIEILSSTLKDNIEQKGEQVVFGDINRLKARLDIICTGRDAAANQRLNSTCQKSSKEIASIQQRLHDS